MLVYKMSKDVYFGGIPMALAIAYSGDKIAASISSAGADVSKGMKSGLEGLMKEEGAGKEMMAEGLKHISEAVSLSWWERVWGTKHPK